MSDLPLALTYVNVPHHNELVSMHFLELLEVAKLGVSIPKGFLITNQTHRQFLEKNNTTFVIEKLTQTHNLENPPEVLSYVETITSHIKNASHHPMLKEVIQLNLSLINEDSPIDFENDLLMIRDSIGNNALVPFDLDAILESLKNSFVHYHSPAVPGQPLVSFLVQIVPPVDIQGTVRYTEKFGIILRIDDREFTLSKTQNFVEGELTQVLNSVQIHRLYELIDVLQKHFYHPREIFFYFVGNDIYYLDSHEYHHPIDSATRYEEQSHVSKTTKNKPVIVGHFRQIQSGLDVGKIKKEEIIIVRNEKLLSAVLAKHHPKAIIFVGIMSKSNQLKIKQKAIPFVALPSLHIEKRFPRHIAKLDLGAGTLSF